MAVEVQFIGRLGNNLFQYALGRIIAEELGYELVCRPAAVAGATEVRPDSGDAATLLDLAGEFLDVPLRIPGKHIRSPHERYVLGERAWSGYGVPLQRILQDRRDRRIVLRGYFQRMEYFAPYRDVVRSWLRPRRSASPPDPDPRHIVVNVRRGYDYQSLGWSLSADYYERVLSQEEPGTVHVCGVGIDNSIRRSLQPYQPVYFSGTPVEEFRFIASFKRIVLSNSTFCWWAAWLSHAEEIHFPRCRGFWGDEFPEVDLEVREDRYRYVEGVDMEVWRPFRRDPAVPLLVSAGATQDTVVVAAGRGGGFKPAMLPASSKALFEWIARRSGSFGFADLHPLVEDEGARRQLKRFISFLIEAEAVQADPLYRAGAGA
jgi:hypothetical protein